MAATLLPLDLERNDGDILNTGSVAIDRAGNVLVVAPAYAPPNLNYDVFRYQPASGWDVELAAQTTTNSSVSDVRVAWFGTGGQAAISYSATGPLSSSVYATGAWSALSITGIRRYAGASSLTTSSLGSVLLTLDGSNTPAGYYQPLPSRLSEEVERGRHLGFLRSCSGSPKVSS